MEVSFSYVPGARERWLEAGGPQVANLRLWWQPGAVLAFAGIAVLVRIAVATRSGGGWTGPALLAGVVGVILLLLPYVGAERHLRSTVRRPGRERQVTVSDHGLRFEGDGVTSDLAWERVERTTETPAHWRIAADNGAKLYLPKTAVGPDDAARLAQLLNAAKVR